MFFFFKLLPVVKEQCCLLPSQQEYTHQVALGVLKAPEVGRAKDWKSFPGANLAGVGAEALHFNLVLFYGTRQRLHRSKF